MKSSLTYVSKFETILFNFDDFCPKLVLQISIYDFLVWKLCSFECLTCIMGGPLWVTTVYYSWSASYSKCYWKLWNWSWNFSKMLHQVCCKRWSNVLLPTFCLWSCNSKLFPSSITVRVEVNFSLSETCHCQHLGNYCPSLISITLYSSKVTFISFKLLVQG